MAVKSLHIQGYRSIQGPVHVHFPEQSPLVLIGENNAGKSNIVRALDFVLGERWPGNHEPEDHEFYDRDPTGALKLTVDLSQVVHSSPYGVEDVASLVWVHPPDDELGRSFYMVMSNGETNKYLSNETREQCIAITVNADRRLSYQLSYTSKWTLLAKLMRQFHRTLSADEEAVARLKARFDEITGIFSEVAEFATFSAELAKVLEELSGNLAYGLTVDFSAYDPSNFFHALRVYPHEDGVVRSFEEMGTGQEQILAIAFAQAYAKAFHGAGASLVLVIEEPEAHLHPLAQQWIGRKIRELAHEPNMQVIVTTHSPAFIDLLDVPGLVLVRRRVEGGTYVTQLTAEELAAFCRALGAPAATAGTILPFYSVAATQEILSGFFARAVVLVEGPTESFALPIYFQRLGLDVAREGIALVAAQGVGNLAKWYRLFSAYDIPTYVAFDNDLTDDADASRRHDLLTTLALDSALHDEILDTEDLLVLERFTVFGRNFEEWFRSAGGVAYSDLEAEARELGGVTSKPLIARYVAERIVLEGDVKERLEALRDRVIATKTAGAGAVSQADDIPF
jgi:putative ATP-dependent endonuclease of OLD family